MDSQESQKPKPATPTDAAEPTKASTYTCCLCSLPVGDEWRGLYVGPVHNRCALDASRDG